MARIREISATSARILDLIRIREYAPIGHPRGLEPNTLLTSESTVLGDAIARKSLRYATSKGKSLRSIDTERLRSFDPDRNDVVIDLFVAKTAATDFLNDVDGVEAVGQKRLGKVRSEFDVEELLDEKHRKILEEKWQLCFSRYWEGVGRFRASIYFHGGVPEMALTDTEGS